MKITEKIPSLQVYLQPKILAILLLGFASGLPLPLTGATLDAVLNEAGVTKTAIGLFAIIGIPYSLKFLWSPLIDRMPIPFLTRKLGRRVSWIMVSQISLVISIIMLGFSNPAESLMLTAMIGLWVAFSSASQDIAIDAYRIESLEENQQAAGASTATFGYIVSAKLIGGALAFWLSDIFSWQVVYVVMAAFMLVGFITILIAGEPERGIALNNRGRQSFAEILHESVISPFADFIRKPGWYMILLFIIFYKFGDAFAGKMTTPFLQDIGFTNSQIAFYLKSFGLAATLLGTFLGGLLVYRIGTLKALFICGILQMVSNLMFVLQAHVGNVEYVLAATIAIENLSGGMGTAAFVGYLSGLCNIKYTATQYALLSSLASTGRTLLSSSSGVFVDLMGWIGFFLLSTAVALSGILIVLWLIRKEKQPPGKITAKVNVE